MAKRASVHVAVFSLSFPTKLTDIHLKRLIVGQNHTVFRLHMANTFNIAALWQDVDDEVVVEGEETHSWIVLSDEIAR